MELHALRLHFYFLKTQKQKKNLEKVLRWKTVSAFAWYKGPSMESDFCGVAVQTQVSLSAPALPMPSAWFSGFSPV